MVWLHTVIDVPAEQLATADAFWSDVLGWPTGAPWPTHPELRSFEPPGGAPSVHLQRIDGEPRVHLDVESRDPDGSVARAVELGAELVAVLDRWTTLLSPGGLPFCVFAAREERAPDPVTWPGGHRGRLAQVCVDSPRTRHDREVDFWRSLLDGRWVGYEAPEFAGRWHDDDGSPLQLLFQRLEEPDGPVRAHLDHATDDVPAEVRRLVALGADDLGPGRGWHVLRAPTGQVFCVTGNSPEQTRTRDL